MKKITCFTANLASGGAEHQMAILCNMLAERNYEITLVTYNNLPDEYDLHPSIKRVIIDKPKNGFLKELAISRYFIGSEMDCVISFRSTPNFIALIPLLFKRGVKVICGERNTTIVPNSREKINYNYLYKRADYIVPNSYTQAKYLKELNKSWSNRIIPIINYTAIDEYTPTPFPQDSDKQLLIGVFARVFPQKNYDRLCQALALLKKRTSRRFKLIWYGERTDMEHAKGSTHIHQLMKDYNVEDVMEVQPVVTDVVKKMEQFHIMCLPSLFEGFSNALSEYICCGKPVVCSDVSDNSVMVHEGENGFLFDPKDIESMCDAFEKALNLNEMQLQQMGIKSRQIAETLFDKETFINSYIKLIEK